MYNLGMSNAHQHPTAPKTANRDRFVEINWKPNRERLYGAFEIRAGSATWTYSGDTDQCGDCGGEIYEVAADGDGLLCMRCKTCGTGHRCWED